MGHRRKSNEAKRKMVGLSMHKQDIELLDWLCRDTNCTRSEVVRQLLQMASRIQDIRAGIATQKMNEYLERIKEEYITSHNVPYANWHKKIVNKKLSRKVQESEEEQPNNTPEEPFITDEEVDAFLASLYEDEENKQRP